MKAKDIGNEYKKLYQEVEIMLSNITELGFDISKYRSELDSIGIKDQYVENFAKASHEGYYTEGIRLLNNLKKRLEKFDIYYKILNSCNFIEIKINNKNIPKDELNQYITQIIYNLKLVSKYNIKDNEIEKQIKDKVYKIAYELIKLEILIKGESEIYLFCKNEDVNIQSFDKLIREEVGALDNNDNNYELLRAKIYEIKSKGITANYFDIDLIRILLTNNKDYNLEESITNRLKNIIEDMENNSALISKQQIEKEIEKLNTKKNKIKNKQKEIKIRIGSLALFISVLVTGGFILKNACKKHAYQEQYLRTIETYSPINGETTIKEEHFTLDKSIKKPSNKVEIKYNDKYKGKTTKDMTLIDVSEYEFENLEDYYEYAVEHIIKPNEQPKDSQGNENASNYQYPYIFVERNTYKDEGEVFNKSNYHYTLISAFYGYIFILAVIETKHIDNKGRTILLGNIKNLSKEIKKLKENKTEYQSIKEKIQEQLQNIMTELNKYEELRNKFNELYEENKYLLNDEEELLRRFNEISEKNDTSKVKKLIKDINNK